MTENSKQSDGDEITVSNMRKLLEEETLAVAKAAELRIREFSSFTNQYAAGELTPEQAADKYYRYREKWEDALPGFTKKIQGASDSEIMEAIEREAGPYTTLAEGRKQYQSLLKRPSR